MQLIDIRTEVLAHGFDPQSFTAARLNNYINDAQYLIARRVNYIGTERQVPIVTVAGQSTYGMIAAGGVAGSAGTAEGGTTDVGQVNVGRVKSVHDITRNLELEAVQERDIDRSSSAQGTPNFYAIAAGGNLILYPTPDNVYSLLVRTWNLPTTLVNDTDVPQLPQDWHRILWEYAVAQCYWAEDDPNMGAQWDAKFEKTLAEFEADQRFPSSDYPTQLNSIWEADKELANNGWALYWGW